MLKKYLIIAVVVFTPLCQPSQAEEKPVLVSEHFTWTTKISCTDPVDDQSITCKITKIKEIPLTVEETPIKEPKAMK